MLQSCDDDGYSLGNYVVRMATVRVISGNSYYLEIDNGKTLFPAASDVLWYKPVDGQRVVANYTLLGDDYGNYDHAVKVNFLSNVLTKTVEDLTAEDEEKFGNDPVRIIDMWAGGNYLNVEFWINLPSQYKHRISLVNNTSEDWPDDGYIHLEYRYNDQDDTTGYWRRSIVSFNLGNYVSEEALAKYNGIKVKTNPASADDTEAWTFEFRESPSSKDISKSEEIVDPEDKIE